LALVFSLAVGLPTSGIAWADPAAPAIADAGMSWPSFRGNDDNNAVVDFPAPRDADEAEMYWAVKSGGGWESSAIGAPIIVDGWLVFCSGTHLFRADRYTGKIDPDTVGVLKGLPSYNIVPPTYAEGKIFVALGEGRIQAFDAQTLKSLWVYKDALGGQGNTQIVYHGGYVYTGFWRSETADANLVCVSAQDDEPLREDELKEAVWTYPQKGGFYWAGAYVNDDFLLVGTDDGEKNYSSQTSKLLSIDPEKGKVIDKIEGLNADIRSTVTYDPDTDRYYFSSKGGSFYSVAVNDDGTFASGTFPKNAADPEAGSVDLKALQLYQLRTTDSEEPKQCTITSTPVIAERRAYVGVGGAGQFSRYAGHGIAVIDIDSWSVAYTARTMGYPQSSGLVTTAYKAADGYNYIYFTENITPGVVRVIKDRPGESAVIGPMTDTVEIAGEDCTFNDIAPVLFTPVAQQAEHCLGSVISDDEGTLYLKNDSAHLMAIGSRHRRLEITARPLKTVYNVGEVFNPSGMKASAVLANGLKREVTSLVTYSAAPLKEYDEDVTISYDRMRYHDRKITGAVNEGGVPSDPIEAVVDISVVVPTPPATPPATPSAIDPSPGAGPPVAALPTTVTPPPESTQPVKVPGKAPAPRKLAVSKRSVKVYFKAPLRTSLVKKLRVAYRVKGTKKWKTKTFAYKAGLTFVKLKNLKKGKRYQVRMQFYNVKGYGKYGPYKTSKKVK
jgi:outer membrane protein assembly factor BamB